MTVSSLEIDRVFILRFWRERGMEAKSPEPWRARIIDVNTGNNFHVSGIDEAFKFIRNQLSAVGDHQ